MMPKFQYHTLTLGLMEADKTRRKTVIIGWALAFVPWLSLIWFKFYDKVYPLKMPHIPVLFALWFVIVCGIVPGIIHTKELRQKLRWTLYIPVFGWAFWIVITVFTAVFFGWIFLIADTVKIAARKPLLYFYDFR
jgi:hypothetical protein